MDFFALTLKRFVWKTKVCYRNVDNQWSKSGHVPNVCQSEK